MIRCTEDRRKEQAHQMRDGKGSVDLDHLFNPEEIGGKGRLFAVNTLKPGCSIGRHQHVGELEVYHITAGEALYDDNGVMVTVRPGDICIARDGDFHSIESTGPDDLAFTALIIYTTKS